jgi:hypothetical protein
LTRIAGFSFRLQTEQTLKGSSSSIPRIAVLFLLSCRPSPYFLSPW